MARPEYDLVVIGGGAGGLVVAAGGAALGAKVALVEKDRLGGDCLWHGCVPSKTLLKSARVAHAMRHADRFALTPADPHPDLAAVMERVANVIGGIAPHDSPERFRALGVEVIQGSGRFVSPRAFEVGGRALTAENFVLATGSRPSLPPIPGLEHIPYLTNETLFDLREPVPRLIVVGAGPVGCEMAQAFRRLGSEVTVVDLAPRILPQEEPDLADAVFAQLRDEGIVFHLGASAREVSGRAGDIRLGIAAQDGSVPTVTGTHLLVAAGRTPNIEGLALDAAGVAVVRGRIHHDGLRTSNRRIHLVGDVAGGQYTHVAEHHAGIVLRHALFRQFWARASVVIPHCVYTEPELAQVGLPESAAREQRIVHRSFVIAYEQIDRARTESAAAGFAKIVVDPRGRLLGAGIVGAQAGELIAEFALAIEKGMKAADLSAVVHAYPTFAQINRRVADQHRNARLTPGARRWVQRLFRLRGA